MVSVTLKMIDEGLSPNLDELSEFISQQLAEDSISVQDNAELTVKVKFTIDNDQEKVLIQLRETNDKHKLGEKVVHYFPSTWKQDITSEAHALIANMAVPA